MKEPIRKPSKAQIEPAMKIAESMTACPKRLMQAESRPRVDDRPPVGVDAPPLR